MMNASHWKSQRLEQKLTGKSNRKYETAKELRIFCSTKPLVSMDTFFLKKNKVSLENVRRELVIKDYELNLMLWPKSC